jgi:hypothetical protein
MALGPQMRTIARPLPAPGRLFYIGRDSRGCWVARDASGRSGGLFAGYAQARKFALDENGRDPEAVVAVSGVLDLALS